MKDNNKTLPMSDVIFTLRLEHGNMAELLALIDDQRHALERGEPLDYELLEHVLEYFFYYPDQCHHPKEDLIYHKLRVRDPASAETVSAIVNDHNALTRLTERFAKLVTDAHEQPPANTDQLAQTMQEFVEHYRQHMAMEEQHLFPTAVEQLSQDDWDEMDFDLFDRDDPLFDHTAEERFTKLRLEIWRLADEEERRRAAREEVVWLENLVNIAQFNEAMDKANTGVRLIPFSEGGYGLQRDGQLLAYIPPCTEARAAWCGHFYMKNRA